MFIYSESNNLMTVLPSTYLDICDSPPFCQHVDDLTSSSKISFSKKHPVDGLKQRFIQVNPESISLIFSWIFLYSHLKVHIYNTESNLITAIECHEFGSDIHDPLRLDCFNFSVVYFNYYYYYYYF